MRWRAGTSAFRSRPCARSASRPTSTWADSRVAATIFSKIVYHRAFHPSYRDDVPYNLVIVQLDEGPRMFSNVHEGDTPSVIGDRVEAVFDQASEDVFIPRFRPLPT